MKGIDVYLVGRRCCIDNSFIEHQVSYTGDRCIVNPVEHYRDNRRILIYETETPGNEVVKEEFIGYCAGLVAIPVVKIGGCQCATGSAVGVVL